MHYNIALLDKKKKYLIALRFMESNALSLSPGLTLFVCFLITKNLKVIFLATVKAL